MPHRIRSSVQVDSSRCINSSPRFRFEAVAALWLGWTCLCLAQSLSPRQIHGVVQDASHAMIDNATVTLKQGSTDLSATTGRDGTFEFRNFSNDKLELLISANAFAATRRIIPAGVRDENLVIVLQPDSASTEIQVTASRTALSLEDAPQSIQILNTADIHTSGALEVDDLLRQVAGFDQFRRTSSRTSHPTTQGVSMRGLGSSGASRALVLLDGVPITDPFGGWVNWSQIPRESVESVEMVRGGASDMYGGEALSGVTQLLTRM